MTDRKHGDRKHGDRSEPTPREVPAEKHEQGHELGDRNARQSGDQPNEGEGNRTAARQYNAHARQSAENPEVVQREAKAAKRAVDGDEGEALKRAEEIGRAAARR